MKASTGCSSGTLALIVIAVRRTELKIAPGADSRTLVLGVELDAVGAIGTHVMFTVGVGSDRGIGERVGVHCLADLLLHVISESVEIRGAIETDVLWVASGGASILRVDR